MPKPSTDSGKKLKHREDMDDEGPESDSSKSN